MNDASHLAKFVPVRAEAPTTLLTDQRSAIVGPTASDEAQRVTVYCEGTIATASPAVTACADRTRVAALP